MKRSYIVGQKTAVFLAVLLAGLGALGCAFTSQIIDRTGFDETEMMYDNLLPDRDLPDITSSIVAQGGGSSGGGAVGGCWSCG